MTTTSLFDYDAAAQEPAYRPQLMEGLVASVGGVDPHLSRAAAAAVHATCDAHTATLLWPSVVAQLLATWHTHARSARLGAALPRAAVQLLAGRMEQDGCPLPASTLKELAMLCRAETKGCRDVGRLLACGELLCALVGSAACCREALQGVMSLLVCRFPKVGRAVCVYECTASVGCTQVRSHCAEQLYVQLLALPAEAEDALGVGLQELETCQELLLSAGWGAGDERVVARLCGLLGLEVVRPARVKAASKPGGGAAAYQSLIDNVARGY